MADIRAKRKLKFSTVDNRWDEKTGLQRDALSSQIIDALKAQEIRRPAMKQQTRDIRLGTPDCRGAGLRWRQERIPHG
jgi:hypothetical protein